MPLARRAAVGTTDAASGGKLNPDIHNLQLTEIRDMTETSVLDSVRALRNQILAKLEENEDFRVLRGLEIVLMRETRPPQGRQFPQGHQAVQPGARAVQDGLAASISTPPYPYSSGLSADEEALSFPKVQAEARPGSEEEMKTFRSILSSVSRGRDT
jgi:hypothetical protein